MKTVYISAVKLHRLLSYFELLGLDIPSLIIQSNVPFSLSRKDKTNEKVPIQYFSKIYNSGARELSKRHGVIPWAAGMGTDYFELVLRAMLSCKTLGEAIDVLVKFDKLMSASKGYRVNQRVDNGACFIGLEFDYDEHNCPFLPKQWEMKEHAIAMAKGSNLRTWHAIFSWLIGREFASLAFQIDSPSVSEAYARYMSKTVGCEAIFGAATSFLSFDAQLLDNEILQTPIALEEFLANSTYHLVVSTGHLPSFTSTVKSLIAASMKNGPITIKDVAHKLYISESTLRRKLSSENSSFQLLKDQVRREVATQALAQGSKSVAEIAEALGFSETSAFIRSFKSWTGLPPAQFMKKSSKQRN
jgi:AraC-like DNA-binding protein